ncbi:MAG TPA: prolyl oligopeptidase family serine peptidase [Candidatus Dormibacteraeota bacterium]|jgi:prolyl oligopeptidase|nr:prolyl oligopeptidase family serine peptidase [Candidatus Dormibacteraeota bacterium]
MFDPSKLPSAGSGSRSILRVCIALLGFVLYAVAGNAQQPAAKCPPATAVKNVHDAYASADIVDPYRWLEDQNSPETRAWIDQEQKCTDAALSPLPGRAAIAKRMSELLHTDTLGTPTERGGYYFFTKRLANEDLSKIYVRRGANAPDEVLIDPLPWSKDHSASATIEGISKDGKLLFYGRREGGQDEVTVHILNLDTKTDLPEVLPRANYFSMEITPDNKSVYYVRVTDNGPRLYHHVMGTDVAKDKLLYGENLGKDKILAVNLSDDGNYLAYLVVYGSGSERTDAYLQDLKAGGPVKPIVNDLVALSYPQWGGNTIYLQTNWKAPLWHVYAVSPTDLAREHWKEVIPETKVKLESITPAGGKLIAVYTKNAASDAKLFDSDGKNEKALSLPTIGSVFSVSGRWETPELFYSFDTFNKPQTTYRYDLAKNEQTVWAENKVPFDGSKYDVEQVWYQSKDKTRVPMFLFHKKGLALDGNNPALLTGYGGFNSSETPYFSSLYALWVERGGVLAWASLRGGGEFGEDWHRAGMMEKKQNVFDDFISAAEYLIANKYTNSSKLSIYGVSNGGLLVGAALTQRPDLFQAVICGYPLLDMLRYQKFMDGPYWVPEYGSSEKPEQFSYLRAYSPYHNVEKGKKYPATLFITGDGDTRVAPLHARKMSALLQASSGSDRPILLLYDTKSGHSGGRPINKIIEEDTDIFSFLFWQLRVPQAGD